ncbi:SRPBCC family protein [Embleya scabrispora]|uniref:SRPBCC family protein n=1 Tax=Embleya scabrispora TaxID=159449 RepID=UPI000361809B|nr:SRPBCC family protein [Embleya scabrispora]MYS87648.1 polyketide cyclase [Streptomyces sp. SID5474]
MWTHEHTVETAVGVEAIWAVLKDLDNWAQWDTSMEAVSLEGPFEVGSHVSMTPSGQEPIRSRIVEIEEHARYADETEFGGVVLRFAHTLTRLPAGGARVTHRLEITGAAADEVGPELGPAITADFPEAMAGLLSHAAALPTPRV